MDIDIEWVGIVVRIWILGYILTAMFLFFCFGVYPLMSFYGYVGTCIAWFIYGWLGGDNFFGALLIAGLVAFILYILCNNEMI